MLNKFFSGKCQLIKPSITAQVHEEALRLKVPFDFSVGQPDFDLSDGVKAAAAEILSGKTNQYLPNAGLPSLRAAIAKSLKGNGAGFTEENVFISAGGAKQAIDMLLRSLLEPNEAVLMFSPYWVSYPEMVRQNSGWPVFFPVFDKVDLVELEAAVFDNKVKIIILNNPTNPTGFVWDEASLLGLGKIAIKHNCLVIADEVYDQFVYEIDSILTRGAKFISLVSLFKNERWRFITVNSFSKTFCMMGHRIGYVLAEKELVGKLAAIQSQSSSAANTFGQMLAEEVLTNFRHEVAERKKTMAARRAAVSVQMILRGLKFINPQGAFYIFFEVPDKKIVGGGSFFQKTMSAGIALVPGEESGAPGWARLCYAGYSADSFLSAFNLFDKALGYYI